MRFTLAAMLSMALALAASPAWAAHPVVTFTTSLGSFQVELTEDLTPVTVTNFLNYVTDGDYNGTFIHRIAVSGVPATPFAVQGGGFKFNGSTADQIATDPPIVNEFSPNRPNVRGTIAMAKSTSPDSATSQWFVNTSDNTFLDSPANSGGFTTFGHVIGDGMAVVDAIAALERINAGGDPFATLPIRGELNGPITADNLVTVTSVATPAPFRNSDNPLDIDDNGVLAPLDALMLISDINNNQARKLPVLFGPLGGQPRYYDVNGDFYITALDALMVIDAVNDLFAGAGGGPGTEGGAAASMTPVPEPATVLLAVALSAGVFAAMRCRAARALL